MKDFIDSLEDTHIQNKLYRAINGRGAFRRFKDTIYYFGIPTCLKVTGKAPPEDCGGIDGYQELLQQIANGDEEMIEWAESMKWKEQSAEEINRNLRWKFR